MAYHIPSLKLWHIQGYSDMAERKVSGAVAKLEENGLTVPGCKKFINTYGKVCDA